MLLIAPFVELKCITILVFLELPVPFNRTICGIEIFLMLSKAGDLEAFNRTICGIEIILDRDPRFP